MFLKICRAHTHSKDSFRVGLSLCLDNRQYLFLQLSSLLRQSVSVIYLKESPHVSQESGRRERIAVLGRYSRKHSGSSHNPGGWR